MKTNTLLNYVLLAVFVLAINPFGYAQQTKLPNVVILATGGTIAGSAESGTEAGYTSGQVGIQTMIDAVPGIKDVANVTGEQISNVGSQDISVEIWLKLASRINELLKIRLKENEKLKKIIDDKTGTAQTNDRKVVYESREKEWLETVRKSLIYLLILIVVLYLIFGNFFKKQLYKSIKIWVIIAAFIIYVLGINIMSRITFWITGKINYFYNNKAPRNVYINL